MLNIYAPVAAAFNRAANEYDQHNHLQKLAGMTLIHLIKKQINTVADMIDIGCGTGAVTKQLATSLNYKKLYAIDIAEQLLAIAKIKLAGTGAHVYKQNFDTLHQSRKTFDLVFSNMALQWSNSLFSTFHRLTSIVNPQGLIAISLPLTGTFAELRHAYALNQFEDLPSIQHYFRLLKFDILFAGSESLRFQFHHTLEALQSIKKTGATYVPHRTQKGLAGKIKLRQLQLTELTYHVGYFIARKPYD